MKKIFKLAAIAVSMALAASLVACSSGDDDVVDTSTGKYLVAAQIDRYVDSIKYEQNVSDDEIKSLKTAHKNVMDFYGDCADCLDKYFALLKGYVNGDERLSLENLNTIKANLEKRLKYLNSCYGKEKEYHRMYVYRPAINDAIDEVKEYSDAREAVLDIGESTGNKILEGKLNDRQAASMSAYIDAAAALKAALTEADSDVCDTIKVADVVIEAFGKFENKFASAAAAKTEIAKVITAVDAMYIQIKAKVCDKIYDKYAEIEYEYYASLSK